MKKAIIFSTMALAVVTIFSCSKESANCNRIAAKILRYDCDRVIFQLLSAENIGDASWTDVQTGSTYSNVVSYYNTCAVNSITNGRLDTVYISVKPSNDRTWDSDCNQCQAISDNPPVIRVDLSAISATPCNQTSQNK